MKKAEIVALGVVLVGLTGAMSVALRPFNRGRQTKSCQSNLKQIGLGFAQYMRDYDEKTPLALNWRTQVSPYLKAPDSLFRCTVPEITYALNRHLAGIHMAAVDNSEITTLCFDSTLPLSGSDTGASLPNPPIHLLGRRDGNNVLFFDGHVEFLQKKPVFRSFAAENAVEQRKQEQWWKNHEAEEKRRQDWLERAKKQKKNAAKKIKIPTKRPREKASFSSCASTDFLTHSPTHGRTFQSRTETQTQGKNWS